MAAILFLLNRTLVLRRAAAPTLAYFALPVLVFGTVFVCVFFVLFRGARNEVSLAAMVGCTHLIPFSHKKQGKQRHHIAPQQHDNISSDLNQAPLITLCQDMALAAQTHTHILVQNAGLHPF